MEKRDNRLYSRQNTSTRARINQSLPLSHKSFPYTWSHVHIYTVDCQRSDETICLVNALTPRQIYAQPRVQRWSHKVREAHATHSHSRRRTLALKKEHFIFVCTQCHPVSLCAQDEEKVYRKLKKKLEMPLKECWWTAHDTESASLTG